MQRLVGSTRSITVHFSSLRGIKRACIHLAGGYIKGLRFAIQGERQRHCRWLCCHHP